MASKLWLSLCLVLFAYNLVSLISECYSVNYKIVERGDKLFDKDTNYLFCTPFWNIKENDNLGFKSDAHNVPVENFLNYSIASIEDRLKARDLFNLNASYILNNKKVCFTATKNDLEEEKRPFNDFLKVYGAFDIFIYSKGKQPFFYERTNQKYDNNPSVYLKAHKQKVFNRNHLLYPGCLNPKNQIFYNRGECLNKCFIQFKMKINLYKFNDSGLFDLNLIAKDGQKNGHNEDYKSSEIKEGVKICLKRCKKTDCFWEVVTSVKIDFHYYRNYLKKDGKLEKVDLTTSIYSAYYSTDDYYLQLFGLLTLFTGTSVVRLLPALLSLSVKTFRRHNFNYYRFFRIFRLFYPKIKFTITFVSFIFVLNQCLAMFSEFEFKSNYPNKTSSSTFITDPFSLIVCIPIRYIIQSFGKDSKNFKESLYLKNHDFKSIEKSTRDALSACSLQTEIYSGNNTMQAEFSISNEVLFKSIR